MRRFAALTLLAGTVLGWACVTPPPPEVEPDVARYLYASVYEARRFYEPTEQGLFVYDIRDGHRRIETFPSPTWKGWNAGWSGLAAHAGTRRIFQVQDGAGIRAFDLDGGERIWETRALEPKAIEAIPDAAERAKAVESGFLYPDRRIGVTKDGRYLLVPDRYSADPERLGHEPPRIVVLDAATGGFVKNIRLPFEAQSPKGPAYGSPHHVHVGRRYIYASMWADGHIYRIDPRTLEVAGSIGPIESGAGLGIQHFSVDEAERRAYVCPVSFFGLAVLDIESGRRLGQWPVPEPKAGSVRARRLASETAKGRRLHNAGMHGIACRPGRPEVWQTEDDYGLIHIWDVSSLPPRHVDAIYIFDDPERTIANFCWVAFGIDGRYAYASNRVIDADSRQVIATLDGINESSIEIHVKDGAIVRTGHDGGSGLDTWVDGFDFPPAG
ncbi:MAG: hypothetical protein JXP34_13295 [Planctomycetes bacterium]|nr:hypothetical protein [Planctomycetota bacterium]